MDCLLSSSQEDSMGDENVTRCSTMAGESRNVQADRSWPVQRYTDVTCGVKVTVERYAELLNRDDPDVNFRYNPYGVSSVGAAEVAQAASRRGEQKAQFTAVAPITEVPPLAQAWVNMLAGFGGGEVVAREGDEYDRPALGIRLPDGYDDVSLDTDNNNKGVKVVVRLEGMFISKTFVVRKGAAPVLLWIATARKKLKQAQTIQKEAERKTQALGITIEVRSDEDD